MDPRHLTVPAPREPITLHIDKLDNRAEGQYLPLPPSREEKYRYYGPQQRGVFVFLAMSFGGVAYGMSRLAAHNWWTSLLFILIAFQATAVAISLRSSTRKRRRDLERHQADALNWPTPNTPWPTVDVFLPSAGEPLHILQNTYSYVARLDWPGVKTVYVLDDSGRVEVNELADRYGFRYLCRPNRGHLKKAGNLAFGFENSNGDFIHIFDADFVPRPEMTRELIPYFDDPHVGIVQTAQFFDVLDSRFNWLQRAAGATQELFYRWVQPARDAVDAAICVGTNAIYRRTALLQVGGFAQIGHSEDVHTGVNLTKAGYHVRYVPLNFAKGICPDNFDGFTNQQYRWCTGSMSLLGDKDFHKSSLSKAQKLCFWTGFLYYIATAVSAFTMPLPVLTMVWAFPEDVIPMNYFTLAGTLLVWLVVMPFLTEGRWSPLVLRVQALIGFCHALALFDIIRGRTEAWVATGAARKTRVSKRVTMLIRAWVIPTQIATWVGICTGIANYGLGRYWVTILFGLPALYFLVPLIIGPRSVGIADQSESHVPSNIRTYIGRASVTKGPHTDASDRRANELLH